MICEGGFGGLWMQFGCFWLFLVVFCALWRFGVVLGVWVSGMVCCVGLGFGG